MERSASRCIYIECDLVWLALKFTRCLDNSLDVRIESPGYSSTASSQTWLTGIVYLGGCLLAEEPHIPCHADTLHQIGESDLVFSSTVMQAM